MSWSGRRPSGKRDGEEGDGPGRLADRLRTGPACGQATDRDGASGGRAGGGEGAKTGSRDLRSSNPFDPTNEGGTAPESSANLGIASSLCSQRQDPPFDRPKDLWWRNRRAYKGVGTPAQFQDLLHSVDCDVIATRLQRGRLHVPLVAVPPVQWGAASLPQPLPHLQRSLG